MPIWRPLLGLHLDAHVARRAGDDLNAPLDVPSAVEVHHLNRRYLSNLRRIMQVEWTSISKVQGALLIWEICS